MVLFDSNRVHSGVVLAQRLAHPPLGERESVERGVEVVVIIKAAEQGSS